ncbi:hypothetical protein BDY21DRAFT_333565 [Lineolata rhizophorae]|uniref:Aminomethyltransferase n=1 Tax=Lineolata rhizophorae TaxID=578093 RepID=A0A6A6PAS1_9PEZI|nr:hypothetical protein BDY21DRAFT_333565 [Lineolata rhizophorae]
MASQRTARAVSPAANCFRLAPCRTYAQLARPAWARAARSSRPASSPLATCDAKPARITSVQNNSNYHKVVLRQSSSSATGEDEPPLKTPLFDLHAEYGAKFVPFGGYTMPVQYSDLSVSESHKWTREKASLFDVSHMVQHTFTGPTAPAFLQSITPSALSTLPPGSSTLSVLLHPTGCIVDDTVITHLPPSTAFPEPTFYTVTNAGTRAKDLAYLSSHLDVWNTERADGDSEQVIHTVARERGLLALQGPLAAEILSEAGLLTGEQGSEKLDLNTLYFSSCTLARMPLSGKGEGVTGALFVSRAGYTGEDGFELSIPADELAAVARRLLALGGEDRLRLAGLGARDSLRLEAGMCLYGHDIDDSTSPAEAGLAWVVAKERRFGGKEEGGFLGAERVLEEVKPKKEGGKGVSRRRIGLIVEGAPAREGAKIVGEGGEEVGVVTSGCPSPSTGKNIAMGYVKDGLQKSGTELGVLVRGKKRKAVVTKMPFVETKYYRKA